MFRVVFLDISAVFYYGRRAGILPVYAYRGRDYIETHNRLYQFGQIQMSGGSAERSRRALPYLLRLGILRSRAQVRAE